MASDSSDLVCCVCGRRLPSRFAVAGRCKADGCESVFCALHWHGGNGLCPRHGGGKAVEEKAPEPAVAEQPVAAPPSVALPEVEPAGSKPKASFLRFVKALCGIRDPQAARDALETQLTGVRTAREPLSARYEALYAEIAAKKKVREAASPARRKMLDMALRALLAEYRSLERELTALYRKEELLVTVRGRMDERVVLGLAMPRAEDVDRLADDLADALETGEDLADAVADLDKVGAHRERHAVDLDAALSEFDEEAAASVETETGAETRRVDTEGLEA